MSLYNKKKTESPGVKVVIKALYISISTRLTHTISLQFYTHHKHTKMFSPSNPKTLHPLQVFSMKPPSSTLSFNKIKTLIHTLIFSHVCRAFRALSKAKSIVIEIVKEIQPINFTYPHNKSIKSKNKLFFGSFRLHYNWCSSHVVPVPAPVLDETHLYYGSTWNSMLSTDQAGEDCGESQLSGYLQWLEEKVHDNSKTETDINEIDKLAEMFIASCHEKFKLEKQESYRRFQEMMARSM